MQFLEYFYLKNFKFDFYNKFTYKNTNNFPQLKKIILNFGCKTTDLKILTASLLALELLTQQKGNFTTTKHSNILLKLRKGNPVGCQVTLRKKQLFFITEKMLINILPKVKNFHGINFKNQKKKNSFSYCISDSFSFTELDTNYYLFNNLPKLSVTFVTNTKTTQELFFLAVFFQFPITKNLSRYNSIGRV